MVCFARSFERGSCSVDEVVDSSDSEPDIDSFRSTLDVSWQAHTVKHLLKFIARHDLLSRKLPLEVEFVQITSNMFSLLRHTFKRIDITCRTSHVSRRAVLPAIFGRCGRCFVDLEICVAFQRESTQ